MGSRGGRRVGKEVSVIVKRKKEIAYFVSHKKLVACLEKFMDDNVQNSVFFYIFLFRHLK